MMSETEEERVAIPEISDEDLERLAERMNPCAKFLKNDAGEFFEDTRGDLYYTQMPKDLRGVGLNSYYYHKPTEPANDLEYLVSIHTYHTISTRLNASVAEVISQIPPEYLEDTVAFWVVHDIPTPVEDIGMSSYYKTETILYKRKETVE